MTPDISQDRFEADYTIETAEAPEAAAEIMAGEQSSGTFTPVGDGLRCELAIIDAKGDKAFCAGGDFASPRAFWHDEYRMNAKIARFPEPFVSLMQGFTMNGGVGLGCRGAHRAVAEDTQIAMPVCGIGLVPDVGGSLILARASGRLGEYLGLTGTRMGPADALHAGFADLQIPRESWPDLIAAPPTGSRRRWSPNTAASRTAICWGASARRSSTRTAPIWKHADPRAVRADEAAAVLEPLEDDRLELGETA